MNVAFLFDPANADGTLGGAELTMVEFIAAAPAQVYVTEADDAETVVVGNCTSFAPDIIEHLRGKKVVRYHNDLARHEHPVLREWLEQNATHIFTSPLHQERYGLDGVWPNIPPAIDAERYRPNRQVRRHRKGACAIGAWQNLGKGQRLVREWSERTNTPLDVYGTGAFIPMGPTLTYRGPLDPADVAQKLWEYEFFVHLPSAVEPFGRAVVEAHHAGCTVITNNLVGARHYIEHDPEALETAAEDFWRVVL